MSDSSVMEMTLKLTGESSRRVTYTDPSAVSAVLAQCREAQAIWAAVPMDERVRRMRLIADDFRAASDEIAQLLSEEKGSPLGECFTSEVVPSGAVFDYWAKETPKILASKRVWINPIQFPFKSGWTEYQARGIIGLITPWNYPVSIPLRTLIPAILAGNGILYKPSEYTPCSGEWLAKLFSRYLPPGLVGIVQGGGDVGAAVASSRLDRLVFVGSVATGRRVAETAARMLTPVSLELGGKDPAIVLKDANMERAASGIVWAALSNAGQNCAAVERVYVVREVADEFIRMVVERVQGLRHPEDVGPLMNERQLKVVTAQVEEALTRGAQALTGGAPSGIGFGYRPTVLVDVNEDMAILREETFGPVLPIMVVDSVDEAVSRANQSSYGLTASIWTQDYALARRLASRLQTGVVTVNNHSFTAALPNVPWGGLKASGYGVTNSPHALMDLVQPRFVLLDRSPVSRELWWYPYTGSLVEMARGIISLSAGSLFQRLAAAIRVLRALPGRLRELA